MRILISFLLLSFITTTSFAQKSKWTTLFDGKNLDNWHIYNHPNESIPSKWKIENGVLGFDPAGTSDWKINDLVSNESYENFELELTWKIEKGGNSGIFYGIMEDKKYNTPYLTSPEIQILDDENHPDAKAGINGNRLGGSLYDMIPSASKANPANEWNKVVIKKLNGKVIVMQNGKMAVTYNTSGDVWNNMVANSKFKTWEGFGKFAEGKIGLQDHGNKVWFKDIRIRRL